MRAERPTIMDRFLNHDFRGDKLFLLEELSTFWNRFWYSRYRSLRGALRQFDSYSSIDRYGMIKWPMCYISLTVTYRVYNTNAANFIADLCQTLEVYAEERGSGKDWDAMLHIAIIFRCICQQFRQVGPIWDNLSGRSTRCAVFGSTQQKFAWFKAWNQRVV